MFNASLQSYIYSKVNILHKEQKRCRPSNLGTVFFFYSLYNQALLLPTRLHAWSPELSPFIIKAHSTFEPGGNTMPDSSSVQPEKLAEVSQLLVTMRKGNK